MTLEQIASIGAGLGGVGAIISLVYASIQIRSNTRAVRAAAFQQVVDSFAGISFEISKERSLTELHLRAANDFASLDPVEREQYTLILLSFLRRAENVYFQTELHMLETSHWSGIRDSIRAALSPPGARSCWATIRNRLNPQFGAFIDEMLR